MNDRRWKCSIIVQNRLLSAIQHILSVLSLLSRGGYCRLPSFNNQIKVWCVLFVSIGCCISRWWMIDGWMEGCIYCVKWRNEGMNKCLLLFIDDSLLSSINRPLFSSLLFSLHCWRLFCFDQKSRINASFHHYRTIALLHVSASSASFRSINQQLINNRSISSRQSIDIDDSEGGRVISKKSARTGEYLCLFVLFDVRCSMDGWMVEGMIEWMNNKEAVVVQSITVVSKRTKKNSDNTQQRLINRSNREQLEYRVCVSIWVISINIGNIAHFCRKHSFHRSTCIFITFHHFSAFLHFSTISPHYRLFSSISPLFIIFHYFHYFPPFSTFSPSTLHPSNRHFSLFLSIVTFHFYPNSPSIDHLVNSPNSPLFSQPLN